MHIASRVRYAGRLALTRMRGEPVLAIAFVYLTHRCNLRCTYCNSPFLETPELTTGQWLAVVHELAALGCGRVTILGGEPLLRPDLAEIIARVRARGMACVLVSNGLLVRKHIDRLRQLSTLVLSLDAVGPANDAVRGAGVYDAVTDAIAAAREAGIPLKVNAVLSVNTAPLLDTLLAFVAEQDLSITLNIVRSGAADLWRNATSIKAEDDDIRQTLERLAALARTNPRLLFSEASYRYAARWGDYARDRYDANELAAGDPRVRTGPRCQAGRYYMSINPDGSVYPCPNTVHRIPGGNVAVDGVAAAWRRLHGHGCVACYTPCLVELNSLFSLQPRVVWNFVRRHARRFS